MKTYLLDTFNRFKRYSEKLDAQTVLCNKCWWVFNDAGEKETYIFKEDGSVLITFSGAVTYGKWEYLPVNKSIIISGNNQSFMVIPSFLDECILALQVDGTNNYAFLIDEQNKYSFAPKTYKDIIGYFEEKEKKAIEAEANRKIIEEQMKLAEIAREEKRKRKEARQEKVDKLKCKADNIAGDIGLLGVLIFILSSCCFCFFTIFIIPEDFIMNYPVIFLIVEALIGLFVGAILTFTINDIIKNKRIKKYIKEHPNDPVIPYLEEKILQIKNPAYLIVGWVFLFYFFLLESLSLYPPMAFICSLNFSLNDKSIPSSVAKAASSHSEVKNPLSVMFIVCSLSSYSPKSVIEVGCLLVWYLNLISPVSVFTSASITTALGEHLTLESAT